MKTAVTFFALLSVCFSFGQLTVSGKVSDTKGKPVAGANIYVDGTYDGATTAADGTFSFETEETGTQTLVVTALLFDSQQMAIDLSSAQNLDIQLKPSENSIDEVVVSAGMMQTGDKARVSVLKPMDIVTTAGSAGNIIAALQTLPGTNNVGEDGRLFVRGGEADETQTFVDGIRVAQPYGATANNVPTRGRFSPFLFSGMAFSTGGYSAEYGQALSSVLLMNTIDEPLQDQTDIALMTVGLGLGQTRKWEKSSVSYNVNYIDLSPYQAVIPQNVDWNRPFQSLSGETVYRYKLTNGLFKFYAAFDATQFDINQESINVPFRTRVDIRNNNFYLNTSYNGSFGNAWRIFGGISYGNGQNDIGLNQDSVDNDENTLHVKGKLQKKFSGSFRLNFGADYFLTDFDETYTQPDFNYESGYTQGLIATFAEGEFSFTKKWGGRAGLRFAHSDLLGESYLSPRVSLAYKVSKHSQFSAAMGDFRQAPRQEYLKYYNAFDFENERALHYILNYQYTVDKQTFRVEAYEKSYSNLVRFDTSSALPTSDYSQDGNGYARGIDVFWRDGKSISNLEYWISYSYIDTQRKYRDFAAKATPGFVADHTLSVVTKYWIDDLRSQLGVTHSFMTGRPFTNPNKEGFMNSKTPAYNSLSVSWAYLIDAQKILYFSASNVLNTANVFGYEYADTAGPEGRFQRRDIVPTADRFFFIGFFWTISSDKKANQLNNL